MKRLLLITPPFLQPNAPYPATPYLTGYLRERGFEVAQADLSIELLNRVFSLGFLNDVSASFEGVLEGNAAWVHERLQLYIRTVDTVMVFLRGEDSTLANLICRPGFLPQGAAFDSTEGLEELFGTLGVQDCARYLCTLYLHDLSDFLRQAVSPHFGIAKYGESIALSVPDFSTLVNELTVNDNAFEIEMFELLDRHMSQFEPDVVGFSVPFPGNLLSALRCAEYIKKAYPHIRTVLGGGYPSTELRNVTDKRLFDYFDYVILDDGELPLERILNAEEASNSDGNYSNAEAELSNTFTVDGFYPSAWNISHASRPCPDFSDLPHQLYFSLFERTNPMHRLWSDGRWNKMMLAHGCYWARCSFCDTSLDYIRRYEAMSVTTIVDHMERVALQAGSNGFHFVDEAAPPKLLKELSLELLRRGHNYTWWTNIRFEAAFTGDLCRLMAAAGCIAVSGGLETASDKLLEVINKGVTIEQATIAMRNFFYSGIMVHAYLMYGLPHQTLQECVDSLEIVRQMFNAQLIDSAFWHRYAMTVHSPMGCEPEKWGVKRRTEAVNAFANNEIRYVENRPYNINLVGEALNEALENYLTGNALDLAANKWFAGKAPATSVEPSLITDHLIKPDASRLFNPDARLIWIGLPVNICAEGILVRTMAEDKQMKFSSADAYFLLEITALASDLDCRLTLGEVKEKYTNNDKPFAELYHSKKWDKLREYGLLQI